MIQHIVKERGCDYSSRRLICLLTVRTLTKRVTIFFLIGRKMSFLLAVILLLIQFLKFTYSKVSISRGLQIRLTDTKHVCYNLYLRKHIIITLFRATLISRIWNGNISQDSNFAILTNHRQSSSWCSFFKLPFLCFI